MISHLESAMVDIIATHYVYVYLLWNFRNFIGH